MLSKEDQEIISIATREIERDPSCGAAFKTVDHSHQPFFFVQNTIRCIVEEELKAVKKGNIPQFSMSADFSPKTDAFLNRLAVEGQAYASPEVKRMMNPLDSLN